MVGLQPTVPIHVQPTVARVLHEYCYFVYVLYVSTSMSMFKLLDTDTDARDNATLSKTIPAGIWATGRRGTQ